jgi:thioredoxin 1
MDWLKILLMMITPGSPLIMKWAMQRKASQKIDQAAPDTSSVDGTTDLSQRLYYFHASFCGPCKSMMPMIDELRTQHPNLIKVDIMEHPTLANAFGVTATPFFIVVNDGYIKEIKLGSPGKKWLQNRLTVDQTCIEKR